MSGSPPFESARTAQAPSSSNSSPHHGILSDASQPRWTLDQQIGTISNRPRGMIPMSNTYPQETPRAPHIRRRSEHRLPPLLTYNTPESISSLHGTPRQPYVSPAPSITPQSAASQIRNPVSEPSVRVTSPRSQRKTKGHVASACVPCKRAHLRCDAQRPCSRCVSHGKEDACIDVQHKKRGRPRLRDDREARIQAARFGHGHELSSSRPSQIRPASMGHPLFYDSPGSAGPSAPGSEFTSPEAPGQRHLPRIFSADAAFRGERPPVHFTDEPVLYIRANNMEIVKASPSFSEAVGASGFVGRRITDIITPEASETIIELCNALNAEQKRREPSYLPPIFDRGEEAVRSLGFTAESVSRVEFNHQTYTTFRSNDGQPRSYPVRLGLLKEGSFFFITALLSVQSRTLYQPSLPQSRDAPPGRAGQDLHTLPRASMMRATPTPMDAAHRRFSDGTSALRREVGRASQPTPQRRSPGSVYQSAYSPSPQGGEYARPSPQQIPRSELGAPSLARPGDSQYTLPPIRSLAARDSPERDDKQRRVTIGGLINSTGA